MNHYAHRGLQLGFDPDNPHVRQGNPRVVHMALEWRWLESRVHIRRDNVVVVVAGPIGQALQVFLQELLVQAAHLPCSNFEVQQGVGVYAGIDDRVDAIVGLQVAWGCALLRRAAEIANVSARTACEELLLQLWHGHLQRRARLDSSSRPRFCSGIVQCNLQGIAALIGGRSMAA